VSIRSDGPGFGVSIPLERAARERHRRRATKVGFLAIVLWALLALLSTASRRLPPFELLALTFAIASLVGLVRMAHAGRSMLSAFQQPAVAWVIGVGGLFGYHALYFFALAKAPAVQVSLIAYLWPLLIVLLSAGDSPGSGWISRFSGAGLGLAGVALLVGRDGGQIAFHREHIMGYLAALGCAFTWSGYSVLNRKLEKGSPDSVAGFCVVTAVLGALAHVATETTVVPTARETMAVFALGLGPVGAAFFLWDHGTKYGDLPLLGVLSYATPLLSTFVLIAFGAATFSWNLALACAFITGGAWLGSRAPT